MRWQDSIDNQNKGAGGGGGRTTKDIGNKNPPTQFSSTYSVMNQKYEIKSKTRGTNKQNSKGNKQSNPMPWEQSNLKSPQKYADRRKNATNDSRKNANPPTKVTHSPSSKPNSNVVRTSGGDLALRNRAMGNGGRSTGRNSTASGGGFIRR